jgi:hypothetical protein
MDAQVIGAIMIAVAVVGWLAWQAQQSQRLRNRYAVKDDRGGREPRERRPETRDVRRARASTRQHFEREVDTPVRRADGIDTARVQQRVREFDREARP